MEVLAQTDLATLRETRKREKEKDKRIQDLELALADQVAVNAELQVRLQDLELAFADLLAGGVS